MYIYIYIYLTPPVKQNKVCYTPGQTVLHPPVKQKSTLFTKSYVILFCFYKIYILDVKVETKAPTFTRALFNFLINLLI